jgi:dipeptidyl-peptidase 4
MDAARARAAGVVRGYQGKVFRQRFEPNWQEDGRWMTYSVSIGPDRSEYVRVDLQRGQRELAVDPQRLADALAEQADVRVPAGDLNLQQLEVLGDGAELEFSVRGRRYRCQLSDYALEPLTPAAPQVSDLLTRARRSTGGQSEINLRLVNRTPGAVSCYWRNTEGDAVRYQTVKADGVLEQHTFAGHVWEFRDEQDTVLARIVAPQQDAEFVLDPAVLEAYRALPEWGPGGGAGRGAAGGGARARADGASQRARGRNRSNSNPGDAPRIFVRDFNLWVGSRGAEPERQLSQGGTPENPFLGDVSWSHSGKLFVARRRTEVPERKIVISEAKLPVAQLHELNYNKPGDPLPQVQLSLFDLESGRQLDVPDSLLTPQWSLSNIRWSSDDSQVTCVFNQRGHQCLRVLSIDPATGNVSVLVDEQSPTFIDYAHKQFLHFDDEREELLWMSERSGWNHLYRYNSRTGECLGPVTGGEWVVRGVERVDEDARQLWLTVSGIVDGQDPYYRHLARVNFDGSGFVVLTAGDGDHTWRFSPDRRYFIDTWSRVDLPPESVLRASEDGRLVCELERADWSHLLAAGWQVPERFVAPGRDGQTAIHGVIIRPSRFEAGKKYPVVEQIYAGPQGAFVPKAFDLQASKTELAELGFIVVQIDGMGTSHRSKAFHDVCWKNLADSGFPDRVLWIRAAADKYPEFDLQRVGIFGGSAGGQNAMRALLDHHDLYRVAVADCGCHDNRMDKIWWNELWMGWPVDDSYAQSSNIEHAGRLEGKLLLVVGEVDRNVDPASTYETAAALVRADKDFELLIMPGAGHGAAESPYGRRRRAEFLMRHLQPDLQ